MTPADQQRLELARRAYRANEPSAVEVQAGVRRARLQLTKRRRSRTWLGKGLILVVLAVGTLAYARPQALSQLVERVISPRAERAGSRARQAGAAAASPQAMTRDGIGSASARFEKPEPSDSRRVDLEAAREETPGAQGKAPSGSVHVGPRRGPRGIAASASGTLASPSGTVASAAPDERGVDDSRTAASPDWSSVGRALANGDEAGALTALSQLSASADRATRDKADLGRAQLLMAHGDRQEACVLARSLSDRQAHDQVERQARTLLGSCPR